MKIVILDTSFIKDLVDFLQKPQELPKLYTTIEDLCRDLVDSLGLYFITSSAKDERKVLSKSIDELSREILDICRIRIPWLRIRKAIRVQKVEQILTKICSSDESKVRSLIDRLSAYAIEIRDLCHKLREDIVRKIVEVDLHIVIASIYFSSSCLDPVVYTADKLLEEELRRVNEMIEDLGFGHRVEVVYRGREV